MGQHELQQPAHVLPQRTFSRISGRILKWAASVTLLLVLSASFNSQDLKSNVLWLAELSTSNWEIKFGSGKICQAPAPNLFAYSPPRPSNDLIAKATKDVDKYLSNRASKPDVNSIAVSIVTAAGPLFEAGYGVLKANETDMEETHPVDRDSIYRIASISKMFTVLETLILRERGALNWDDPVEKFLPEFKPPSSGWSGYLSGLDSKEKPHITLRQLASHLAGIGRDYPPSETENWPLSGLPTDKKHDIANITSRASTEPGPSYDEFLKVVSKYPLVNVPYGYPVYSNTGMSLLGLSNIAANKIISSDPPNEPQTHKELVKRDIFDPLQMNSSFYRVPSDETLRAHIAVPLIHSEWADISLGDVVDPAGGQYSSLGDLATLMKTLLSPIGRGGVVPANVVREWLRPLYTWNTGSEEVGAPWEIITSISGPKAYTKGGNLPGYHSEFAVIPEYSVGIILLVTGQYSDTSTILKEVAKRFIPTVEKLHHSEIEKRYAGTWANGEDIAEIESKKGVLKVKKLVVSGVDVLKSMYDALNGVDGTATRGVQQQIGSVPPVALWSTGQVGEFRLAFGRPSLNNVRDIGCAPYWISLDIALHSRGAPIDLLYWKNGVLSYPSSGVSFGRKR